jgi:hypothetical protein
VKRALAIVFPVAAQAEITSTTQLSRLLRDGEKANGFDWQDRDWDYARFKPEKYVAQLKVSDPLTDRCDDLEFKQRVEVESMAVEYACYNFSEMRKKPSSLFFSSVCDEAWRKQGNKKMLAEIEFRDIRFVPKGRFISVFWRSSSLVGDTSPAEKSALKRTQISERFEASTNVRAF